MNSRITILDYGVGNTYGVQRAFEVCGEHNVCISSDPEIILDSGRLVIPGVGAFADGMSGLRERGLDLIVSEYARSHRPILGICLGMQIFATLSYEFKECAGLNLISGKVIPILSKGVDGNLLKIPHVGWSSLDCPSEGAWKNTVLKSLSPEQSVYLIHSFQVIPDKRNEILATYQYGGHEIVAAIKKDNITGLQFHPEKSGQVGLSILKEFISD